MTLLLPGHCLLLPGKLSLPARLLRVSCPQPGGIRRLGGEQTLGSSPELELAKASAVCLREKGMSSVLIKLSSFSLRWRVVGALVLNLRTLGTGLGLAHNGL